MLNQSKSNLNFRILKFLLITPLLVIIPTLTNTSDLRAGLEFQWDQNTGYKRLKWFQKENQIRFRNLQSSKCSNLKIRKYLVTQT